MNAPPTEHLGDRIRKAREAKGLTQAQVAEHFKIRPQSVSKWERGPGQPKKTRVWQLADLFGVTAEWLMTGDGASPSMGQRDLAVKAAEQAISLTGFDVSPARRHEIIAKVLADLIDLKVETDPPRTNGSAPTPRPAKKR